MPNVLKLVEKGVVWVAEYENKHPPEPEHPPVDDVTFDVTSWNGQPHYGSLDTPYDSNIKPTIRMSQSGGYGYKIPSIPEKEWIPLMKYIYVRYADKLHVGIEMYKTKPWQFNIVEHGAKGYYW